MENNTLKKIMNFLKEKENKSSVKWKLLNNEPLTEEELNVKGYLDLENTNIKSLPEGLRVDGFLNLENCTSLTSLPKGLYVGGSLDLTNCTSLTSLPKGLYVEGYLHLESCTSLTLLPKGLYVEDCLWLENCTSLTSLPKGLEVGYDLHILNTPLAKLSDETLRNMVGDEGYIKGDIIRH